MNELLSGTGKVKWFDATQGSGVVESPEFPGDVFVHESAIQASGYGDLHQGQRVEFDCRAVADQDGCRFVAEGLRPLPDSD